MVADRGHAVLRGGKRPFGPVNRDVNVASSTQHARMGQDTCRRPNGCNVDMMHLRCTANSNRRSDGTIGRRITVERLAPWARLVCRYLKTFRASKDNEIGPCVCHATAESSRKTSTASIGATNCGQDSYTILCLPEQSVPQVGDNCPQPRMRCAFEGQDGTLCLVSAGTIVLCCPRPEQTDSKSGR